MKEIKVIVNNLRNEISKNQMKKYEKDFFNLKVEAEKENFEMKKDPDENFLFTYEQMPKRKVKMEVTRKEFKSYPKTTFSKFQCKICSKFLSSEKSLEYHTNCHYKPTNFNCKNCKKTYQTKNSFQKHSCISSTCPHCQQVLSSSGYLKGHLKRVHNIQMIADGFECDFCGDHFSSKIKIASHIKTCMHRLQLKYFCDHCDKEFTKKVYLRAHVLSHAVHRVECKVCYKKIQPGFLSTHLKNFHPKREENFKCTKCPKTFKTQTLFKLHLKTHDKKAPCPYCKRVFISKTFLTYHMKCHLNPEDFSCKICGHHSADKRDLRRHLETHNKNREKPFECPRCEFKTAGKQYFHQHLKLHENLDEKLKTWPDAIQCKKCRAVLKNPKCYKLHHSRKHGSVKRFHCDCCGVGFYYKYEVAEHFLKKH